MIWTIIQLVISGIAMGFVYALIGIEYTLIYNASGVLNFSHDKMVSLGAYIYAGMFVLGLGWNSVVSAIASLLLTALLCLLLALAALWLGLLMPNLTWTSEIAPIKQGGAVAISLLGGWVFAAAVGVSGALLAPRLGAGGCLLLLSGVAVVLSRVLAAWLSKRGAKRFAEL